MILHPSRLAWIDRNLEDAAAARDLLLRTLRVVQWMLRGRTDEDVLQPTKIVDTTAIASVGSWMSIRESTPPGAFEHQACAWTISWVRGV